MISLEEIRAAAERLDGVAVRTPLVGMTSAGLLLKAENLQPVGSFKLRGAYNLIAQLNQEALGRGVVGYSSGNHAQGVAFAARAIGTRAVIVMPDNANESKRRATAEFGAEIVTVGPSSEERRSRAEQIAAEFGMELVPPFDHERIICGQATVGLEIGEDCPEVELVLVPVGGGGLAGGVAAALKLMGSGAKVIGVEPELAADAAESLARGEIVSWEAAQVTRSIADGLRTQRVGARTFGPMKKFLDGIVTVSEEEIVSAMQQIEAETGMIAEPSGAVAAAAWLFHRDQLPVATKVVAIVSGGNV